MEWMNGTLVTEFVLLGFPMARGLQLLLFLALLLVYITTLVGNLTIIGVTWTNAHLRTPMYFFLRNLAFLDIWFTSAIVPKMLTNLLMETKTISYGGCMLQSYIYFVLGTTEFILLAVMSFDRYVAICHPLRYSAIMSQRLCIHLVLGSWLGGFLDTIIQTVLTLRLPFCGPNVINHYFCDVEPLLKLACADTSLIGKLDFALASSVVLGSLFWSLISYTCIAVAIARIPSADGRRKAFNTCASHVTVVALVYGSCIFMCARPAQDSALDSNKIVAVLNSILTPLLNPFIYSLRNKSVKDALKQALAKNLFLKGEKH
ncbi:olfactory receptor 6M1-like [Rhinatrema bivittatum]|uniref:olfactory receptor 6M1-like n=1 Tax=Rhinatrema bivittatum TaxID=194408 RepID=UPI00112CE78C|nr:olfactory receptor 6M1-like [Rhinatrema bivittatum]